VPAAAGFGSLFGRRHLIYRYWNSMLNRGNCSVQVLEKGWSLVRLWA
jgi:hypothetical protein